MATELCQRWPNSGHKAGVKISALEMREADLNCLPVGCTSWEQCAWPAAGRQNAARQKVSIALVLTISSTTAVF